MTETRTPLPLVVRRIIINLSPVFPDGYPAVKKSDMNNRLFIAALLLIFLASCGRHKSENLTVAMDEPGEDQMVVTDEAMNEIVQNIASPIEVAALMSELQIPFSTAYLIDAEKVSTQATTFEMAYSLGALGADLGYLNMYEKTGSAVNYLATINRLADALQVGQFFDFVRIKRLATSRGDLDSLIFLSINSFNEMDEHLRNTGRSNLSALMVTGIWIEGMYLATQVDLKQESERINKMIGEQKLILNDLLLVLKLYKEDPWFAAILKDYEELRNIYNDVKISYEIGEPQTVEQDGMLMVIQNETTHVEMSERTLKRIADMTMHIRDNHLKMSEKR